MYDSPRDTRREASVGRTRPSAAGSLAVVIWILFAGLALIVATASVAAFAGLANGLEDPRQLENLSFQQESVILDRTGTIELARFGQTKRELVAFEDLPPIVVDAQTAIEDKTFWENPGFDPLAIVSAGIDSLRGRSRGASTITQQLVRQRLLPADLVQDPKRQAERKLKEIIQSIRLTQAYPGEAGKQRIITAYLNQNYYGNQSYGVKAAAESYFGVTDLAELTPAQAAILAALPKSPSNYDLVLNAVEECPEPIDEEDPEAKCPVETLLVVPEDTDVVRRRNQILDLLAEGDRTPLSGTQYSAADFKAAKAEKVVLAKRTNPRWIAPHFVWAVQEELATKLCGEGVPTCETLEDGGLRITTTLDTRLQEIAEKWVKAAAIVPNAKNPAAAAKALGLSYTNWMKALRGKQVRNGAIVALDYQTGELIAYVGSADYYAAKSSKRFQAKYDVVGSGWRQPGSAFKPFNYLTGIDDRVMTAGSVFMDSATDFGGDYSPSDADNLERGPVRARTALQFSLNIPSVKAMQVNSPEHVFSRAREFGMRFQTETSRAGLALALGVQEVRPVDLVTAYGTLANGGKYIGHTTILSIKDPGGTDIVKPYTPPEAVQAASPQAAFIVTDMLAGNTNPKVNPFWGKFALKDADGTRRPATLKTGTNNDAKDLNAYGFIAPPTADGRAAGEYALAVGAWNGNSDNSNVSTAARPVFSIDVTTYVWQGFLQEASRKWAVNNFAQPDGLVKAEIDPFTGLQPQAGGTAIEEWFIEGTAPQSALPEGVCGADTLQYIGFEKNYDNWLLADRNWINRATKGAGVSGGVNKTRTSYFYNGSFTPYGKSWGALVAGHGCAAPSPSPTPSCIPLPTPDPSGVIPSFVLPTPDPSGGAVAIPCPTAVPSASVEPSVEPTIAPTPPPDPTPTPPPDPTPTPPPDPTPTPPPDPSPAASAPVAPNP